MTTASDWDELSKTYVDRSERLTWPFARDGLTLAGFSSKIENETPLKLLDVACGPGRLAVEAANMGFDVTATDWSSGMIELVQKRAEAASLHIATLATDGQTLEGLPDSTFDVVTSTFGLFHFADREEGWRSVLRVLKPGGRVMGAVWIPSGGSFPAIRKYLTHNAEDYADPEQGNTVRDSGHDHTHEHDHEGHQQDETHLLHHAEQHGRGHNHSHEHAHGHTGHRGCFLFPDASDFEHELTKCGFANPVIHIVHHDVCFSRGKDVVEMHIKPALTAKQLDGKDSRSLKLCLMHYLDLISQGVDPFGEHAPPPPKLADGIVAEEMKFWEQPVVIPTSAYVGVAYKPMQGTEDGRFARQGRACTRRRVTSNFS